LNKAANLASTAMMTSQAASVANDPVISLIKQQMAGANNHLASLKSDMDDF